MHVTVTVEGRTITVTTDHAASSHGLPVVVIDGELTDIPAEYEADAGDNRLHSGDPADQVGLALGALHRAQGGFAGRRTLDELHALASDMLANVPGGAADVRGEHLQAVIDEFARRGREQRGAEMQGE